nr:hypothetical protein 12 [Saccharospirillaceae bacterium]
MAKKETFIVTGLAPIEADGKTFSKKGEPIELTDEQAQPLLSRGYLRRPKPTAKSKASD